MWLSIVCVTVNRTEPPVHTGHLLGLGGLGGVSLGEYFCMGGGWDVSMWSITRVGVESTNWKNLKPSYSISKQLKKRDRKMWVSFYVLHWKCRGGFWKCRYSSNFSLAFFTWPVEFNNGRKSGRSGPMSLKIIAGISGIRSTDTDWFHRKGQLREDPLLWLLIRKSQLDFHQVHDT